MAEYSRIAKGSVVTSSAGGTSPIRLPFIPDRVEFIDYTSMTTPTAGQVVKGSWDVTMGQGAAAYDTYAAGPVYSTATTLTGGISTFTAGQSLQFGAKKQVVAAGPSAGSTSFTVTNHGYVSGDVVQFSGLYQTATTGLPQLSGMSFRIVVVDVNTFLIAWNSSGSNYTPLSGSPVGAFVFKVLYPFIYFPGVNNIAIINFGSPSTTIITTSSHNYVVGQEVAFRMPAAWGTVELNSLPNELVPGSPIYYVVDSVTDDLTFSVRVNSTGFTPYNVNVPVANVPGLTPAQVVAVGDFNTGGVQYSGGNLYPSPVAREYTGLVPTINGPAIQGAFVNNTSQGFIIGTTVAPTAGHTLYWQAYLDDFSSP